VLDWFEAGDLPGFRLRGRRGAPLRFRWSEIEATLEGWRPAGAPGREAPATRTDNARHARGYSAVRSASPASRAARGGADEKE